VPSPVTLRRVQEIVGRVAELDAIRSWLEASSPPILLLPSTKKRGGP
jgi:hypothetical protein